MRKGFTREPKRDEPAVRVKNYITPGGLERLKDEHRFLLTRERPAVTKVVCIRQTNPCKAQDLLAAQRSGVSDLTSLRSL